MLPRLKLIGEAFSLLCLAGIAKLLFLSNETVQVNFALWAIDILARMEKIERQDPWKRPK